MVTFDEAKERALQEPTLEDALAYMSIWEMERIVKKVRQDPGTWESCFKHIHRIILEEYGSTKNTT